jgi:hypothetical protein
MLKLLFESRKRAETEDLEQDCPNKTGGAVLFFVLETHFNVYSNKIYTNYSRFGTLYST